MWCSERWPGVEQVSAQTADWSEQLSIEAGAMRILIFGAGAVGSFLGNRLQSAGNDVTLAGRSSFVRAVRKHGLTLEERARTGVHAGAGSLLRVVYPRAVESIEDVPRSKRTWDLMLLTVKAHDTHEAAQALEPFASPRVPLLIVQNGVGGEEAVSEVLKEAPIISGVITMSVSVLEPGHVRLETTRGGLNLAPTGVGQGLDPWAAVLAAAGLRPAIYPDYRALKWSKLLLNLQANAIPAILDMAPADVFSQPALFEVERAAFLEAAAVMQALALRPVSFPSYPVPILAWAMRAVPSPVLRPILRRIVGSGRGDKKPSLQLDLARGRPHSEVLYLNGAVVTHARRVGREAPVNSYLMATLIDIASGRVLWDEFRGQPDKLLADIEGKRRLAHGPAGGME